MAWIGLALGRPAWIPDKRPRRIELALRDSQSRPAQITSSASEIDLDTELQEAARQDDERLLPGGPVSLVRIEDRADVEQIVNICDRAECRAVHPDQLHQADVNLV